MADVSESQAATAKSLQQHYASLFAQAPRADALFIGVIAIVGLLVMALTWAFIAHNSLQARTLDTIAIARGVRDESVSIAQGLVEVQATRRAARARDARGSSTVLAAAEGSVLDHVRTLQGHCEDAPELAAIAERLDDIIDAEFALSHQRMPESLFLSQSAQLRAELWASLALLQTEANELNDTARALAARTRQQLDVIAIALGVLSLAAAGFAVISLQRERERWRIARDAAEDAYAKAAASERAKTRFLAVASHDMRQPLHALTLYLTALERRVENAEAREIIIKMDRAVQSMIGMFSSLLDLARLQAGVITPEIEDAPLQSVFDATAAAHADGAVHVTPTPLAVRTDPRLLERIIANLVANAVRHGGGAAWLSAELRGGDVAIIVRDQGPGIAPADHERMFVEFERLGARTDGLGLGLPIVKRLSEILGVELKVRSAQGEGAQFTIIAPAAAAPCAIEEPQTCEDINGAAVLVMDDDPLARSAITGFLQDLGADVRACANGEEAASIVAGGFAPRLLVLDLRINGELLGLAIAARLGALITPSPRVIIVTGDTEEETLESLRASGHQWLIKPVSAQDLSAIAAAELRAA